VDPEETTSISGIKSRRKGNQYPTYYEPKLDFNYDSLELSAEIID
jgi:hypothetical protein